MEPSAKELGIWHKRHKTTFGIWRRQHSGQVKRRLLVSGQQTEPLEHR